MDVQIVQFGVYFYVGEAKTVFFTQARVSKVSYVWLTCFIPPIHRFHSDLMRSNAFNPSFHKV